MLAQCLDEFETVHRLHADVANDQSGIGRFDLRQCVVTVARLRDIAKADLAQHRHDQLSNEVVVFDHQHPNRRCIGFHHFTPVVAGWASSRITASRTRRNAG